MGSRPLFVDLETGADAAPEAGDPRPTAADTDLLDAYSRTIVAVVEQIGPAVGFIAVRKRVRDRAGR